MSADGRSCGLRPSEPSIRCRWPGLLACRRLRRSGGGGHCGRCVDERQPGRGRPRYVPVRPPCRPIRQYQVRRNRRAAHDAPSGCVFHQPPEHTDRRARDLTSRAARLHVVAKAEVKQMPVLGQLFTLADVAFVDRTNTSKAISALQPAVDRLRRGVSIAMSPEGTRSFSPRIGAFKKGGFHMARDAGVRSFRSSSAMPVKSCGATRRWPRKALSKSLSTDRSTANWTKGDLDEWVPRLRQLYIDTLDDWPGTVAGEEWSAAIAEASAVRK